MLRLASSIKPRLPRTLDKVQARRNFHSGWKGFDPDFRKRVSQTLSFETSHNLFREIEDHAMRVWKMKVLFDQVPLLSPLPKWYKKDDHERLQQDIAFLAKASEDFMNSLLAVDDRLQGIVEKGEAGLDNLVPTV